MKQKFIYLVSVLIALILVFGIFWGYWVMETLPVARADLEKIELNMSKESVENILGPPAGITKYSGGDLYRYSKDEKWIMVDIQFNSDGKVRNIEIDR